MNIPELRLQNQQLSGTALQTGQEMVRWFGAVQGQEYGPTKWGLGLRLTHLNDAALELELTAGKILRTHLLRPTWHFVSAEDIRWMLQLSASRVHQANAFMYRKLELDAMVFNPCNDLIIKALEENSALTREEIAVEFKRNSIEAEGHRLSYIMMQAELEGIICSGARRGNQFTYTLLEERVKQVPAKTLEEALAELTRRYFQSRGPATLKDFSTWSGLTMADCKNGIALLQPELNREKAGNDAFYMFGNNNSLKKSSSFQLLPIYDEYVMGYKDKSHMFQFRNRIKPEPPIAFQNMILEDGQIIGSWRREILSKSIEFDYALFADPDPETQQLFENSIRRFEEFIALPVQLQPA